MARTFWPPEKTFNYKFDLNPELEIPLVDNVKTKGNDEKENDKEI